MLSIEECQALVERDEARVCAASDEAVEEGAFVRGGACVWWLRSPGLFGDRAAGVDLDGGVYERGFGVIKSDIAVRPALWVNLKT